MKRWLILLLSLFLLAACSQTPATPSESDIQTAIAMTKEAIPTATPSETPNPTSTITPSSTPEPTSTSTATNTPRPTKTPSPTNTPRPTNTSTSTPLPPEVQTATAESLVKTQKIVDATATRVALENRRTATAEAKSAWATETSQYYRIDVRELITYPKRHIGEKVILRGRIFNVVSDYRIQVWADWTYEAVVVDLRSPLSGVYQDDLIHVYGTIAGVDCFENAYGAEICQPILEDAFYEKY